MPCIPSSFSLFISNPVSHSCNTKRFLASFTHYTCIRVLLLSLVPFSFLGFFFLCAKAFKCCFIMQCTPLLLHPAFSGTGRSLTALFLLSSFSVVHHSFLFSSVHEGVHDNIINTQHRGRTLSAMTHEYSPHV